MNASSPRWYDNAKRNILVAKDMTGHIKTTKGWNY